MALLRCAIVRIIVVLARLTLLSKEMSDRGRKGQKRLLIMALQKAHCNENAASGSEACSDMLLVMSRSETLQLSGIASKRQSDLLFDILKHVNDLLEAVSKL